MRRLIDLSKSFIQRVNPRFAVGAVATVLLSLGVWKGLAWMRPAQQPPTKQVAVGMDKSGVVGSPVQPAVAALTDDQLPSGSTPYTKTIERSYASAPPQPQMNPYLPTSSDPAGGYGNSGQRYATGSGQYAQSAESAQDAPVPTDPTATSPPTSPSAGVPANPYRLSDADTPEPSQPAEPAAPPPLEQSPYAAVANSGVGYGSSYGQTAVTPSLPQPPAQPVAPPNTLPQTDLSTNPDAAASQGLNRLGAASVGSGSNVSNFDRPYTSLPPKGEAASRLAASTPGERNYEGPQQPAVSLEKVSPAEIQVGKPAVFELYVRNSGPVPAQGVVVTDYVPAGTQLIDVRPQPQQAADGSLLWNLGTMQPGEQTQITLQVMPQTEGEIGSTAHVTFAAAATSRSICTRPQLAIEQSAPPKVLIGEPLAVAITVSNPGTGPATGVIIEEDVPPGLAHGAGSQLEYEVGALRPGESKRLELSLRAERAGIVQNRIQVRGDAGLAAQHVVQIEVVAPQLAVAVEGPKRRFLERQATYTLEIVNSGTAAARDVELVAFLPRGMKFITSDSQGLYDAGQHAVLWSLAELPPATKGAVKLTMLPVEPGEQQIRVEGRAALGITAGDQQVVQVDQAAELLHTVKDLDEVIEVGSETTYEIRVTNKGTKAATNVRVAALMPAGMAAINGEGPTRATGDTTQIVFEPLARLNPQEEVIYKVQVQARQPGDHLVRVQLSSDEWPTAVTREESTRVYQDR
jgi:uncharacterized repeat protein (TIGR01451 family)